MTQPDGISPRLHRQHPANMDGLSSVTPTSACNSTGFFKEEDHSYRIPTEDTSKKSRSRSQAVLLSPVCLKKPHHPSHHKPNNSRNLCFVGFLLITLMAIAPLLLGSKGTPPLESTRVLREVVVDDKKVEARCNARRLWGGHVSHGRDQCVKVLPSSVVEREDSWLIAVHVDRKPVSPSESLRGGLRGSIQHRNLPHLYFVRALEATLHGLSKIEPGATVDVAVLTEGRWGGLVDEVGMPVDFDIPKHICSHLGLHCIQSMVLLNDNIEVTDALECAANADVLVSSESDFSVASSALSPRVKILTDKWTTDEMEMKIALNPAGTVAGMPQSQRDLIKNTLFEYHECSLHR